MKKLLILGLFLLSISVNAQTKPKSQENYNLIKEGKGMSGITIGRSSMDDVIKKFGKEYKWIVNKKYSYQMNYYKLGLAFYICQSDKRKQIFVIEIKSPYKAKTPKGIILGKSTLEDVHKKYGKLKSGTEYRGVSFYYNNIGGKNIITGIDVTENSGIRQCRAAK
jgi:hypothetical protein